MLELKIVCDSPEEARHVLNAQQYHNLLTDLYQALRSAHKHGDDKDVLRVVESFLPSLCHALDNSEGAY